MLLFITTIGSTAPDSDIGANSVTVFLLLLLDGNDDNDDDIGSDDDNSSFFFLRLEDRCFDFDEAIATPVAPFLAVVVVIVSFAWELSSSSSYSSLDRFHF